MSQISELQEILFHFLNWNKARVTCLVQILQGLFLVRTVNLTQIAETFQTSATQASSYRRIQRFFKEFSFDISFIVILVSKLFIMGKKCILIIDRTNWKWGKVHINIFMVSIEHFGIGIPIFWTILDKGGTSSSQDRITLLSKVIKKLGRENIKVILGDREFVGELWFRFLIENAIPFVIRVKGCFLVEGVQSGCAVPINALVRKLGRKKRIINHSIILWGHSLFASVEYAKDAKEPLIIVSNKALPNALDLYRWRWGIETLFSCLKTRGFHMEDTHMIEPAKIEKLMFVLAVAFCWAYKTGELLARQKPIKVKKHKRKAKSVFRVGLDFIRSGLFKLEKWIDPYMSLWEYFNPIKSEVGSI